MKHERICLFSSPLPMLYMTEFLDILKCLIYLIFKSFEGCTFVFLCIMNNLLCLISIYHPNSSKANEEFFLTMGAFHGRRYLNQISCSSNKIFSSPLSAEERHFHPAQSWSCVRKCACACFK